MSKLNLQSTVQLNNGVAMPRLGLGVYQSPVGKATYDAVTNALKFGYRHIDTAAIYGNEADVGTAIRESEVPRESIFLTTKLWNADQGYDEALRAFDISLEKLGVEVLDLYLLHWPVEEKRLQSWKALEKLYEEKRIRAIGVSNFTVTHLKELLKNAKVPPTVNQVEMSPFLTQKELVTFCNENKIVVEAYSPLTKGRKLNDKTLVALGQSYKKTPAQILLRWALQSGLVPLPKSNHIERIHENADVYDFEISERDMERLDGLNVNFRTSWDPTNVV